MRVYAFSAIAVLSAGQGLLLVYLLVANADERRTLPGLLILAAGAIAAVLFFALTAFAVYVLVGLG